MEISVKRHELNEVYYPLERKRAELTRTLPHRMFDLSSGFYNGHYRETPDGSYRIDYYPIPVVSVRGLCEIEIDFECLSVSTKKKRQDTLEYSFENLAGYSFEAFGVENYLQTYCKEGLSFADMKRNIAESTEEEIGFSFSFPFDISGETLFEFLKLLRREGFYY